MTSKRLEGIDGVLGNLISVTPQETGRRPNVARQPKHENPQRARLGRPPGKSGDARPAKEKATFRISGSLIAEYRDRSWEARCSLSGLVEKAMLEYRQRFDE